MSEKGNRNQPGRRESGFTLVEVLVSSTILVVTLGVVLTVFIASQRVLENAMSQVQLSLELRLLREKLLFHIDENGGLMNARYTTLDVDNATDGWGDTLTYAPLGGGAGTNVVMRSSETQKLTAETQRTDGWLSSGALVIDAAGPFSTTERDGEILINANARIQIGNRAYRQRQLIRSPVMAE